MARFDYSAPAEIFESGGVGKRKHPVRYRRFSKGADAVRFATEGVPATVLARIVLESDEDRFDHSGIRALYDSPDYPLEREAPAS